MHKQLILSLGCLILLISSIPIQAAQRDLSISIPQMAEHAQTKSRKSIRQELKGKRKAIRKEHKDLQKKDGTKVLFYVLAGIGALVIAGLFFLLGIYLGFSMNAFLVLLAWGGGLALTVFFIIWAIRKINAL